MSSRLFKLSRSKTALVTSVALSVAALTGTSVGYAALNDQVTLVLDGQQQQVSAMGGTVGDVLAAQGISIGEHDVVAPAADRAITDGTEITVRYGRPLTLTVDGQPQTHWVTATNVDDALREIGDRFQGDNLSVSRSAPLGRSGATVAVVTRKEVKLKVGDKPKDKIFVTALTVGDLLAKREIAHDSDDIVWPSKTTVLKPGTRVKLTRVKVAQKTVKSEPVPFETREKPSATLYKGDTKVLRPGVEGKRSVTYRLRYENGDLVNTKVLSSEVVAQPRDEIVLVGTKAGVPFGVWDRLAQCESGGNWSINTGNGYYGGLQFNVGTWQSYGGTGLPSQHSREEQIAIAEKLRAASGGFGAWPACAASLGLPR